MKAPGFVLRLVLVAVVLVACDAGATAEPTVDEAKAYLGRVVALARAGDFDGLCAIGDGNCRHHLDDGGRDRVPLDPPTIVSVRHVASTSTASGGIVLGLCGRNRAGEPYHSEMLVFRYQGSLIAINPVYWDNTLIADGNTAAASAEAGGADAPTAAC